MATTAPGENARRTTTGAVGRPRPSRDLWQTARPLQWSKNLLVFAAPGAAGVLDDWPDLGRAVLTFVAFCLASSGLYFWNDVLDVESDRLHPAKRTRPVAAGRVSITSAATWGTALILAGVVVALATGHWTTAAVLGVYVASTMAYSLVLKHEPVLDLVVIAAGFVLRAAAGAVAVDVEMSSWFVLFTVFGSLFIVAGKRYAELRDIGDGAADIRRTLGTYTPGFLRIVVTMSVTGALLTYCQWAFEVKELAGSVLPFYELSIVPMLAALLRYALVLETGQGAAPEEIFARDRVLQLLGVAWLVLFGLGVYLQ